MEKENMPQLSESEALDEFRNILAEFQPDIPEDAVLISFLRAANMNPVKAKILFKEYLNLRCRLTNSTQISFDKCIPAQVKDDMQFKVLGSDYEGRLVLWAAVGRWEVRKLIENGFREELFKYAYKVGDDVRRELHLLGKKAGKPINCVAFADLGELTFKKLSHYETIQASMEFARIAESFFALADKVYVINAHWVCQYLLNVIRPILSKANFAKLEILGTDPKKWRVALNERIPAETLPIDYGGLGPKVL